MQVEVRHALRDADVGGYERAISFEPCFHGDCKALHREEKGTDLGRGEIAQRFIVDLWNDEDVPWQQWTMVEESEDG